MADHDGNHRCFVEKNVPIVFIFPRRWWDGAECLGIDQCLFMLSPCSSRRKEREREKKSFKRQPEQANIASKTLKHKIIV